MTKNEQIEEALRQLVAEIYQSLAPSGVRYCGDFEDEIKAVAAAINSPE